MTGYNSADELRFRFGKNWRRFLRQVGDTKISVAEDSLKALLGRSDLRGQKLLDIGSGSGLFSLAARRLGARVHSFDYDADSVWCTEELRRRFEPDTSLWSVERGSILDTNYIQHLGQFDIVYSWGVLHHTGAMWDAIENAAGLVAANGTLVIAIYNDQGGWSRRWKIIKRAYNSLPTFIRTAYMVTLMVPREFYSLLAHTVGGHPLQYFRNIVNYAETSQRGMSWWRDQIDWFGGYPFEVAKPEEVFKFLRERGFFLTHLKTCAGGLGCNEFVFRRLADSQTPAVDP